MSDREEGCSLPGFFLYQNEDDMNKQLTSMIATLLIFPLAAVAAQTAGDEVAEPLPDDVADMVNEAIQNLREVMSGQHSA